MEHVFAQMAVVLALAATAGALALWLRQPLILAFIIIGTLVGPVGLDWIPDGQFDLLAEMGIGLLLFVVGLKLDPALIRSIGNVALIAGLGQILTTFGLGYLLAVALGQTEWAAFYVAAALTFSSTIIIVKLLSDKREIDALYGRIALGILIIQDIVVVFLMLGLAAFGQQEPGAALGYEFLGVLAKGTAFIVGVGILARLVIPRLLHSLARLPELLVLFGIAWAIGLAAIGDSLGFSKEVGAFIGGVALAVTPYRAAIGARLVSLRDFLLLFFFIDLGINIDITHFSMAIGPALVLSLFVLLGKPLMVMSLVGLAGYSKRTLALTGFSLGQISEFSFILAAMGLSLGHIDEHVLGLIVLVGLITIGLSSYMIMGSQSLYARLSTWLGVFERRHQHPREAAIANGHSHAVPPAEVIVLGLGRYGGELAEFLLQRKRRVLGVDFNPELLRWWERQGVPTLYGDVDDAELFHAIPIDTASWVVSTIPERDHGLALLHSLQHAGYRGRVALTAHNRKEQVFLQAAGADLVLLPFRDAAKEAVDRITTYETGEEPGSPDGTRT